MTQSTISCQTRVKDGALNSDIIVALHEYEDGTFKVVVAREHQVINELNAINRKFAVQAFHNLQIEYFGKIIEKAK